MIQTLSDLKKLLELCRKQGVLEIKLCEVEFKLGALPDEQRPEGDPARPYANFPQGELTDEQLAFYSAGGLPEDDPALQGRDS